MANPSGQHKHHHQPRQRILAGTTKAYNPHHRSSEVFSTGLLQPLETKNTSVEYGTSSSGSSTQLDISMVRPRTIEEAIKQMQQVPSVDFACSGLSASNGTLPQQTPFQSGQHYQPYNHHQYYHNHPLEGYEEERPQYRINHQDYPQNNHFSATNRSSTLPYTNGTFHSTFDNFHHSQPYHQSYTSIVDNYPSDHQMDNHGDMIISSPSTSSMLFSTGNQPQPQPSSRWLEPPIPPLPSSSSLSSFHRKYSVNNGTLPASLAANSTFTTAKPSTLANHSYSYGNNSKVLQNQNNKSRINSMKRSATGGNSSFRSSASISSPHKSNSGFSTSANLANTTITTTSRRLTVARLGSESGVDSETSSSHYFVPRESWLTSLYVKMPKSKSFFRLQLELLNTPLFASVGRFLEQTCSTSGTASGLGTAEDEKTLLEKNSFLFALFNQYVPHNRIPLESLSKYVRRLQKFEILATIEFSFLKTPSINQHRRRTSGSLTGSGPNGIATSTSSTASNLGGGKQHRYSRQRYAIPSQSACSMRQANRRENLPKNTNQRYVPFDYNRVVLRNDGTDHRRRTPTSDYINASHVDSLLKPNAYIVAQGPNENTVGDFWCMLWQQNVHVVVMLTKVYEFIRVMCTQYWPGTLNKPEVYDNGQFEVTLVDEDRLADYVVRTMKVRNLRLFPRKKNDEGGEDDEINFPSTSKSANSSQGMYRTIYQLHFLSWNVNSCPYSDSILKFRRRVQIYERQCQADASAASTSTSTSCGPLVVHCSTGCGRSGTYVCLDANLQLAEEEGVLDIFNYARALRRARVSMIEHLEQYKFIYETIEESYVCGKTWFHVSEISAQMKAKSVKSCLTTKTKKGKKNGNNTNEKSSGRGKSSSNNGSSAANGKNEYQVEFEKLLKMTSNFSIGDCAGGHRLENRYKNRDVSIVPPDNFRPYLTSFQSKDNTDYINAVFVDGYSRPREYIVTEWPLRSTVPDIWSLVYDHDCNTVVVLGGVPPHSAKSAYPPFWPKDASKGPTKYGSIWTVETISTNHPPNISSWVLRINKKVMSLTELMAGIKAEPKITQVFEFGAWPADYKVPTSTNALVELIHMVERWRQRTSYGPVLVISANGKSRVGVYCAANFAIEQVVAHEEIDIFNAVKTVRRHRSALIETIMEYKYCYDLCLHYYSHYMSKGNYNQIFRKNL